MVFSGSLFNHRTEIVSHEYTCYLSAFNLNIFADPRAGFSGMRIMMRTAKLTSIFLKCKPRPAFDRGTGVHSAQGPCRGHAPRYMVFIAEAET